MNRLILLAATFVLATGVMQGQSSPTAIQTERPNAAPDQTQQGTVANPHATPPIVPHQRPETSANPDRPGAAPQTTLPNTTIDDQQPGNSSGSPASTMGTTGSTPGTEQSPEGNKSNKPDSTQAPENKPAPPHETSPSGSSNPSSSANGASSNDMSGATPKAENPHPDNSTNSTNPQTTPPHVATHVPDPGTEMNPAALELPVGDEPAVKQISNYLPLASAVGMITLALGIFLG